MSSEPTYASEDRPWDFVLYDGRTRRSDLHIYETVGDGAIHNRTVALPHSRGSRQYWWLYCGYV